MEKLGSKRRILLSGNDPTDNLVASWEFETNFNDYTGNHNASLFGSVNFIAGKVGSCAQFLGDNDRLLVSDSDDFSFVDVNGDVPFSIALWFYLDSYNEGISSLINKRRSLTLNGEWEFSVNSSNQVRFSMGDFGFVNRLDINSVATASLGTWHHAVVTYDGSKKASGLRMYVDKILSGTAVETGTYVGMANGTAELIIGTYGITSNQRELHGNLEEIKIYKGRRFLHSEIIKMHDDEIVGTSYLP